MTEELNVVCFVYEVRLVCPLGGFGSQIVPFNVSPRPLCFGSSRMFSLICKRLLSVSRCAATFSTAADQILLCFTSDSLRMHFYTKDAWAPRPSRKSSVPPPPITLLASSVFAGGSESPSAVKVSSETCYRAARLNANPQSQIKLEGYLYFPDSAPFARMLSLCWSIFSGDAAAVHESWDNSLACTYTSV